MNLLLVGRDKRPLLSRLPERFLLIDDGTMIDALDFSQNRFFDFQKHSFNPLRGMTYRKAREFSALLYAASPQGQNTLTVRNGRRALSRIVLEGSRLDKLHFDGSDADEEAKGMIEDVLFSPVLKDVLCGSPNFSFKGTILVRLDPTVLDRFDRFLLANLLIAQYQGTVILPDFGFYGSPLHTSLIDQGRLIAGVNFLSEKPELRDDLLGIETKIPSRCSFDDAETLGKYAGLTPHTNEFGDFVHRSMGLLPESESL